MKCLRLDLHFLIKKIACSLKLREPSGGVDFGRFNPALDLQPGFLEQDCKMAEVHHLTDQVLLYINCHTRAQLPIST